MIRTISYLYALSYKWYEFPRSTSKMMCLYKTVQKETFLKIESSSFISYVFNNRCTPKSVYSFAVYTVVCFKSRTIWNYKLYTTFDFRLIWNPFLWSFIWYELLLLLNPFFNSYKTDVSFSLYGNYIHAERNYWSKTIKTGIS